MLAITHRAAVLGQPVRHSLSPVLHRAAYTALGLRHWHYGMYEVGTDSFLALLGGMDPSWRGLSLTMPLKEIAFQAARSVSDLAREVGAVNTLVRDGDGWRAENTDVHGIAATLRAAGVGDLTNLAPPVVIGTGATARAAVAAIAALGAAQVVFMVRAEPRGETVAQAGRAGLRVRHVPIGAWPGDVSVVVSTVPPAATVPAADTLPEGGSVLLEVVYGEGQTVLMSRAIERGYRTVPGTEMLLHQAGVQVRLMTGLEPPLDVMRAAMEAELTARRAGRPSP